MKRILLIAGCLMMVVVLLAGCGKQGAGVTDNGNFSKDAKYPLNTDTELKYWLPLHNNVSATSANVGDTPYAKEVERVTGVKVKYIHPVQGQEIEQFNLLLASSELPDMVEYRWYNIAGGPTKAFDDGYITSLKAYIDNNAPNLKKYLNENPDVDKMVKTDEGEYYVFPFIRGDEILLISLGNIIRKDWLDSLGLELPETYDDYYDVLKQFKEKKGASAPLSYMVKDAEQLAVFYNIFNVNVRNCYIDDNGKVQAGILDPEVKEVTQMLRKWYAEGLIDNNFSSNDTKILEANILNNKTGLTVGSVGSGLGKWLPMGREMDKNFDLAGSHIAVKNKGEKVKFGSAQAMYPGNGSVAISKSSKNPELAAKYLDYFYGEEGHMLANFGIEGVSYNMENDYPKYTDEIMNNPDKLPVNSAMGKYFRSSYAGPFVQDKRYMEQFYALPQQKQAHAMWSADVKNELKYQLPSVLPTAEESRRAATITNNIDSYKTSMLVKFIMGNEDIAKYDAFVEQLKSYGIEELVGIYQSALDRYNKR